MTQQTPSINEVIPSWSEKQREIIEGDEFSRILVDAGPGTGKTAVACARIAWLINEAGLEPTQIWLISFTRTAVHELRNRIKLYLGNLSVGDGIKIATIDSHAWAIQSGFRQNASLSGSFDDNIKQVIELVKHHEGVFEYLNEVRHLIVDEAQDIVGNRCELLLELIDALPKESGVTVFADEAQAIYGFAEEETLDAVEGTLPNQIREWMPDFKNLELTELHRTSDAKLNSIFTIGRAIVKGQGSASKSRLSEIRNLIESDNHENLGNHRESLKSLPASFENGFLLFRRRGEVLEASSYLANRPHKLRISSLPIMLHAWIGLMFWDWVEPEIDCLRFIVRWNERNIIAPYAAPEAWNILVRLVGISEKRISVSRLAKRIASSSPPVELYSPDFGFNGPLLGTIHGAKGREADEVRLYLPPHSDSKEDDNNSDEEARVLFVGATRAKLNLKVGHGASRALARSLDSSGRAFTSYPHKGGRKVARACVEIGRIGDIEPACLVGRSLFRSSNDARAAQDLISQLAGNISDAEASLGTKENNWHYIVTKKFADRPLCYLSQNVNHDMFEIGKIIDQYVHLNKKKPPDRIPYLRTFGTRTIAVAPDDPIRESLHNPWRDSGFMVAPLLIGYSMVWFR